MPCTQATTRPKTPEPERFDLPNQFLCFQQFRTPCQFIRIGRSGPSTPDWTTPPTTFWNNDWGALEGGIGAVVTASGTAAISTTLLVLLKAGDHIVASNSLYGGTYNLLKVTLPRLGITTTFVNPSDPANFTKAAKKTPESFLLNPWEIQIGRAGLESHFGRSQSLQSAFYCR